MAKRLRIIAGPNGSGKSSVYEALRLNNNFNWGVFVNADEIEKQLREQGFLDVTTLGIADFAWAEFLKEYQPFVEQKQGKCGCENLKYIDKKIVVWDQQKVDSYLACFVAEYVRRALLDVSGNVVFTVETVMSHPSKLDFMREARRKGFRVYLYYVATSSPEINIGRVATRVEKGGHGVLEEKIVSRYYRSLNLLLEAVLVSDRAYLFDNSTSAYKWVAEYDGQTGSLMYKDDEVPEWVQKSLHKTN